MPVIILNKSDTCSDITDQVEEIRSEIKGIPIIPVSAAEKSGLDNLKPYLGPEKTVVIIGSSGVTSPAPPRARPYTAWGVPGPWRCSRG